MSDLSNERVREIAEDGEVWIEPLAESDFGRGVGHENWPSEEARALAREVLALRVTLAVLDGSACAEEQANGNGPCGVCKVCLRADIATLTRQRDEAIEIANEGMGNCAWCDGASGDLRARLAAITGEAP